VEGMTVSHYQASQGSISAGHPSGPGPSGIWKSSRRHLFQVFYSYAGLENVNNVPNEVKDPVRTLKSIVPIALLSAYVLYLLINIAYLLVILIDKIKDSGELIAGLFFERIFGDSIGRQILPWFIALSAWGYVMVVTFSLVFTLHWTDGQKLTYQSLV
jgi:amino acid transporter